MPHLTPPAPHCEFSPNFLRDQGRLGGAEAGRSGGPAHPRTFTPPPTYVTGSRGCQGRGEILPCAPIMG